MAKQQDSSRVSFISITDMSLTNTTTLTEIQKAQKVLKSVQELDVLPICDIVNVSKKTQENFLKEFNHKPSIQHIQHTKKFFNKEKVKLENEYKKLEDECNKLQKKNKESDKEYLAKVTEIKATYIEIKAISKVLDIATLLEKYSLNIIDILKTAGISLDICDKLDKDYTIKQALQCLEKWNNELTTGNNDPNTPSPTVSAHDQLIQEFKSKMKKNDSQESGYSGSSSGSSSDESSNSFSSSKPLLANSSTISNKLPPCPPPRDYSKHKQNVDIPNKYHDSDHHDTYYHPILGEHTDVSF